jgi:integrase
MRWDAVEDGAWTVPRASREKGTGGVLVLPETAIAILAAQPRLADNPYVFAGRRRNRWNGFRSAGDALDAKLPPEMPRWTIHDLRRTARSLMSRAGVASEVAERIMGHVQPGVEGIYDRHSYRDEKAAALGKLARLIETIVNPPEPNVVPIRRQELAR